MDIVAVDIASGELTELLATAAHEAFPSLSPDGRWVAYESDVEVEGRPEVYVSPYPDMPSRSFKISSGGGQSPRWSGDGREIFFVAPSQAIMVVAVATEPGFSAGAPTELIPPSLGIANQMARFDISRQDGRFLMHRVPRHERRGMTVVLNWFEDLKERVSDGQP